MNAEVRADPEAEAGAEAKWGRSGLNGLLRQLARPSTEADRKRARLVAIAVTGCGES